MILSSFLAFKRVLSDMNRKKQFRRPRLKSRSPEVRLFFKTLKQGSVRLDYLITLTALVVPSV